MSQEVFRSLDCISRHQIRLEHRIRLKWSDILDKIKTQTKPLEWRSDVPNVDDVNSSSTIQLRLTLRVDKEGSFNVIVTNIGDEAVNVHSYDLSLFFEGETNELQFEKGWTLTPAPNSSDDNSMETNFGPVKNFSTADVKASEFLIVQAILITETEVHETTKHPVQVKVFTGDSMSSALSLANLSDLTLVSSNDSFKVHKVILANKSEVFKKMFQENPRCTSINMEGEGFSERSVKLFVDFIYTNSVEGLDEVVARTLLRMADKYKVVGLKRLTSHYLRQKLDFDNAAELLVLAHSFQEKALENKALGFIASNFSQVKDTPGWLKMRKSQLDLVDEVITALSKCKSTNKQ